MIIGYVSYDHVVLCLVCVRRIYLAVGLGVNRSLDGLGFKGIGLCRFGGLQFWYFRRLTTKDKKFFNFFKTIS